jgi:hypothetical protein
MYARVISFQEKPQDVDLASEKSRRRYCPVPSKMMVTGAT